MEVFETRALPSFDHNSKPTFPYTAAAISHPELSSVTARSPEHTGYPDPHLPEELGLPVAGGDSECRDAGDGMALVQNSDSASPVEAVLNNDTGGDVLAPKLERCPSDAAMKVQKVYRSYRTRRMLADSAVVAEELWWQAISFARLNHSTISFFNFEPESAASRWNRVSLIASKVGKGLSKDAKAQKLAFQHWIEAIDPRHRYGHSLHLYYDEWCKTDAGQPFFYWLDLGDGREVDLEECPRSKLRQQCIKYLGPKEREHYEYVVVEGKFLHKQTGNTLDTTGGKWIFVVSTSKRLYAGEKKKGNFHHSSFLAGGVTLAAGRMVVVDGTLKSISAYSGHYRPTEDSLDGFLQFLKESGVNLDLVEIRKPREYEDYYEEKTSKDVPSSQVREIPDSSSGEANKHLDEEEKPKKLWPEAAIEEEQVSSRSETSTDYKRSLSGGLQSPRADVPRKAILQRINSKKASYQLGNQLSLKWSTGAGPRIGCVADYPIELRLQALELTNLSPRPSSATTPTPRRNGGLPSPIRWSSQELVNNNDM